jgi:hypothetical protein
MRWPSIPSPSRRDLVVFGAGLWSLSLLLAGLFWIRGASWLGTALAGGIPLALALVFVAAPPARRPLYLGVARLLYPIGLVVTAVLLGLLFFGLMTPVGLLRRGMGADPLRLRRPTPGFSLWSRSADPPEARRYFRPY